MSVQRDEMLNWIARFVLAGLLIQPVMLVLDVIVVYPVLGGRTFIATFQWSWLLCATGSAAGLAWLRRGPRSIVVMHVVIGLVLAPAYIVLAWAIFAANK
jgi:hypothetical protein